ncbi:hypothetical protein E4G67_05500 [Candidatus Bathyarchaeota archaeon]|nr:MAG: hypothetical protein E4G67_05500 [Candidatus Bathyarchaeota archaeon]
MLSDIDLEALIHRAISFYNRIHSPNAIAKLISFSPTLISVQFSGGFCTGCGTMESTEALVDLTKTISQGKTDLKQNKTIQTNLHTIQTTYIIKTK